MSKRVCLLIVSCLVIFPSLVIANEGKSVKATSSDIEGVERVKPQMNEPVVSKTRVVKRYKTKGRASGSSKYSTIEIIAEQDKAIVRNQLIDKVNDQGSQAKQAKHISPLLGLAPIDKKPPPSVSPVGQWLNKGFTWIDDWFVEKEVKPWQKAKLAEPVMLPGGVAPVMKKFATKIYISKAATLGGDGIAGGGCGCK